MLEIVVLAAPLVVVVAFLLLLWRGFRRDAATLERGLTARGWRMVRTAEGLPTILVPFAGREIALEGYRVTAPKSIEARLALRYVGLSGVGDLQLVPVSEYAADKVQAGLSEMATDAPFRASFRSFAADPQSFANVFTGELRQALVAAKLPLRLAFEKGTLLVSFTETFDLDVLDRVLAIFGAIVAPNLRAAPLRVDPRATTSAFWGCAVGGALLAGFIGGIMGLAFLPLPDLALGRAIAAPVVCPHGGVPDVVHYNKGAGKSSWNVACQKKAESRTSSSIHVDGDHEPSLYPNLTTAVLSFEVYGLLIMVAVGALLAPFGLATKPAS